MDVYLPSLQTAHFESLALLGQLIKVNSSHQRFLQLSILSSPDPEADFFENMKHIQVRLVTLT